MYLTYLTKQPNTQLSLEALILQLQTNHYTTETWEMRTVNVPTEAIKPIKQVPMYQFLDTITPQVEAMANSDLSKHYRSFKLPKKTGGHRTIDAPDAILSNLLTQIKVGFENVLQTLPHNAAYAYTKTRSPLKAMQKHQTNNAEYFLKIDIKDFFGSCNEEFVYNQLKQLYPFAVLTKNETYDKIIKDIIKCASYNNKLPQGTPLSPLLTNLIMIPFDYLITHRLKDYTYTRYADDMTITSPNSFHFTTIINIIKDILKDTPLQIKPEKTRYGSYKGSNWNLGIMYNQDKELTIGHKRKQKIKAAIDQFLHNPTQLSNHQKEQLHGLLAYGTHIEPDYFQYIINKYNNKHNKDLLYLLTH